MITACSENLIIIWNENYEIVKTLEDIDASSVTFSPNGAKFVTGGMNDVKIWDAKTYECSKTIEDNMCTTEIVFSLDGSSFFVGAEEGVL